MGTHHRDPTRPKARKRHQCIACLHPIEGGEVHVHQTGIFDGYAYRNREVVRVATPPQAGQAEQDQWEAFLSQPEIVFGVNAERREDMSQRGRLRLCAQEDGDMCVMVIEDGGNSAGVEFCNSGGHSPRTLQALRDLSRAMQADNEDYAFALGTRADAPPDATPAQAGEVVLVPRKLTAAMAMTMKERLGHPDSSPQETWERILAATPQPAQPSELDGVFWRDGAPKKPWSSEWFIAVTTDGDRVVLRELPEEYTYDFTTADATYFMRHKVKKWAQFPDSQFISPPAPPLDSPIDASDNADYIEHCAAKLTRLGYPITGRVLDAIASEHRNLARPASEGAVTDAMVERAVEAYHEEWYAGGVTHRACLRAALTAALTSQQQAEVAK